MSAAVTTAGPDRLQVLTPTVLVVTAGVVVVVGLQAATGSSTPSTFADPGALTTTGLPLARYLQDVAGTLVVGCALLPVLQPGAAVARRAHALLTPGALA